MQSESRLNHMYDVVVNAAFSIPTRVGNLGARDNADQVGTVHAARYRRKASSRTCAHSRSCVSVRPLTAHVRQCISIRVQTTAPSGQLTNLTASETETGERRRRNNKTHLFVGISTAGVRAHRRDGVCPSTLLRNMWEETCRHRRLLQMCDTCRAMDNDRSKQTSHECDSETCALTGMLLLFVMGSLVQYL